MRLYVIIRGDLTWSQRAVQAGHAVAAFMRLPGYMPQETLIYLKVHNLQDLKEIYDTMNRYHQWPIAFHEPDMDNQMTAFAMTVREEHRSAQTLLDSLPLL